LPCCLSIRALTSLGNGLQLPSNAWKHFHAALYAEPPESPSRHLKNLVQTKNAACFGEVPVTAFTLYRSFLRPAGAIHEPVETYPLKGGC
jgi:2'-5' RNA ligase